MTREEDTIVRLWAEGVSTTKIGEVLGISCSAVCGRMHRMRKRGVDLREPMFKKPNGSTHHAHVPPARQKGPRDAPPATREISPVGVSIVDLAPWHCRSIMPPKPDAELPVYCGALKREGSSYCAGHHQLYHMVKQAQTPA